jgi:hypothetical protein
MGKRARPKQRTAKWRVSGEAQPWAHRIEKSWAQTLDALRKTVVRAVATGRLLIEAKEELGHGNFGLMFRADAHPPFDQRKAERLMEIARNGVLANSANLPNLPPAESTLHVLAELPPAVLQEAIDRGAVTSKTTREQAARLASSHDKLVENARSFTTRWLLRSPPGSESIVGDTLRAIGDEVLAKTKPSWEETLRVSVRKFARTELGRCPSDAVWIVGHTLRMVAHEALTPLPVEVQERLHRQLQELEAELDQLKHEGEEAAWIIEQGGLKYSKDYPDVRPLGVLRRGGRSYDELATDRAKQTGRRPRDVEREQMRYFRKRRPRVEEPRKAREALIALLKDVIDGRALVVEEELVSKGLIERGKIPAYTIGSTPLNFEVAAEMRRHAQLAKDAIAREEGEGDDDPSRPVPRNRRRLFARKLRALRRAKTPPRPRRADT